jgi:hypothetical protein
MNMTSPRIQNTDMIVKNLMFHAGKPRWSKTTSLVSRMPLTVPENGQQAEWRSLYEKAASELKNKFQLG